MSDVAGIEELCDLRAAARASASIEAGKVIDSFCCRLEALLRNRQELIGALELAAYEFDTPIARRRLPGDESTSAVRLEMREVIGKARELDND